MQYLLTEQEYLAFLKIEEQLIKQNNRLLAGEKEELAQELGKELHSLREAKRLLQSLVELRRYKKQMGRKTLWYNGENPKRWQEAEAFLDALVTEKP